MALKAGRVRLSTWLDEDSETLTSLDAICKKMGTTRGEVIRYIVIDWLESRHQSLPIPGAPPPAETSPRPQATTPTKGTIRGNDAAASFLKLDE